MSSPRAIRRDVKQLLKALGQDVTEITGSLDTQGVRGVPENSEQCVLAAYLNAVVGADPLVQSVRVLRETVHVRLTSRLCLPIVISLPVELRCFVRAFDAQLIPALLASSLRARRGKAVVRRS